MADRGPDPTLTPGHLAAHFRSGDTLRSRSVGGTVLATVLDIPSPPPRLQADWARDAAVQLGLEPGDVEALPLVRTQARWPGCRPCVQAMANWTHGLGLGQLLAGSDLALMACRGAYYHHDAAHYGAAAFCNLFLSEDRGLDVVFPAIGRRLPLVRGTALLFDTGQPHAVVPRHSDRFDAADFGPERDALQVFLSWELPIEDARVARVLGIAFDTEPAPSAPQGHAHLRRNGQPASVCPLSGRWLDAE